ncbi:338326fe-8aa4-4f55-9401-5f7522f92489 [Sclerotinia trifoliorum]|uniref:338326fe-8aa4-4f55-9401-5f7522f92489 n=1 Tax=Sclerotinia trifoliorum TaxID=28548 RepID=A0A8H2ZTH3_9HELO|nr:338326fe-8aa4-4f55-9401-5f7522f92489 [Sclerotinia trifoliorum]
MKPPKNYLLVLAAFFGLATAMVIPANSNDVPRVSATTTTKEEHSVPFNITKFRINPPFVVLHSSPPSPAPSRSNAKRTFGKPWKARQKATPRPCPYPKTRPCITQKEIDQGWHDVNGCFNETYFFVMGHTYCWEAGDDCVKADCRY